jgi:hypothetical protein
MTVRPNHLGSALKRPAVSAREPPALVPATLGVERAVRAVDVTG